jgi:hypothetical protein
VKPLDFQILLAVPGLALRSFFPEAGVLNLDWQISMMKKKNPNWKSF